MVTEPLRILMRISNYFQTLEIMGEQLSDENEPWSGFQWVGDVHSSINSSGYRFESVIPYRNMKYRIFRCIKGADASMYQKCRYIEVISNCQWNNNELREKVGCVRTEEVGQSVERRRIQLYHSLEHLGPARINSSYRVTGKLSTCEAKICLNPPWSRPFSHRYFP